MDIYEVRHFEDYYRGHTIEQLTGMFTNEDSGFRVETKEAIKNLIQQKGGLDVALQNYYKNFSTEQLFELLVKKEKTLDVNITKAVKFNINKNEGTLDNFINQKNSDGGKIVFKINETKSKEVANKVNKIDYFEGNLFLTDKKIFFIPKKLKYLPNSAIQRIIISVCSLSGLGIGLGSGAGGSGVGIGALLGIILCVPYTMFLTQSKQIPQYDLPLTLQTTYIQGSIQLNLSDIKAVTLGKKKNYFVIERENKIRTRFEIKKEYADEVVSFFQNILK